MCKSLVLASERNYIFTTNVHPFSRQPTVLVLTLYSSSLQIGRQRVIEITSSSLRDPALNLRLTHMDVIARKPRADGGGCPA